MPWTYTISWHDSGPKLSGPEWINEHEKFAPVKNTNSNAINYLGSSIRMLSIIKYAKWKCNSCSIDHFNSSQDLYTHLELNHNSSNTTIREKKLSRQRGTKNSKQNSKRLGKMERPETQQDYNQKFQSICTFCRTSFGSFRSRKFQKKEMNNTKRMHQCSLCDSKFLNHQTLQHHLKKLHLCYTCHTTLEVLAKLQTI